MIIMQGSNGPKYKLLSSMYAYIGLISHDKEGIENLRWEIHTKMRSNGTYPLL